MLESEIIAHCAPTLAGIKTANMFSYNAKKPQDLNREICEVNQKLNHKGVFVEILRTSDKRALIYVYRRKNLEADLKREGAENLLPAVTNAVKQGTVRTVSGTSSPVSPGMIVFPTRLVCFWDIPLMT